MKLILLSFTLLTLSACNNSSGSSAGNPRVGENDTTKANATLLTSTRWCAGHDDDGDGKIGTFLFTADQQVEWVGYDLNTQKAYSREKMGWLLQSDFLQIGNEIQTTNGVKISFSNFGADRKMMWVEASNARQIPQNPNTPSLGTSKPPTFVGHPCDLDL